MKRVKNFLVANSFDILIIGVFLIFFCLLIFVFNGYLGHFIFDCGREAYLPLEVLNGKVLYKDIFNYFGPFSYQVNAFFYLIFGVKLSTLYIAGAVNSIIILSCVYLIIRNFTTKPISYLVIFFIMISCVFKNTSLFNFIFPYSYAMVYALSSFLLSVLFLIYFLKTSKPFFVLLSWFFIGVSVASKYEYLIYVFFLAILVFFIKPVQRKYIFYSVLSFLTAPLISFSILFFQGLTLSDIVNSLYITKKYIESNSLNCFYHQSSGLFFNKEKLLSNFLLFAEFMLAAFSFILSTHVLFISKRKNWNKPLRVFLFALSGFTAYILCEFVLLNSIKMFSFFPFLVLLILIGFLFGFIKKIAQNNKANNFFSIKNSIKEYLSTTDGLYLVIIFVALTSCIKVFYSLALNLYGTFFFPLVFVVSVVFLVEYIPRIFKISNKDLWRRSTSILLIILSFLYLSISMFSLRTFYKYPIEGRGDKMYSDDHYIAKTSIDVIDYINKNMNPSSSFIVFPEGLMFNFLTRHPSNSFYYTALMPPHIEAFEEDNIIKALSQDPPDYIFIHNFNMYNYCAGRTCVTSGLKVCEWIYGNYSKIKVFGTGFTMTLYKNIK